MRVLGEHAADGLLDGLGRVLVQHLGVACATSGRPGSRSGGRRASARAWRRSGRTLSALTIDDEVAHVDVRGEGRLVLAAQQHGHLAGEPAEHDVGGVDDVPLTLRRRRAWGVRTHGRSLRSQVVDWSIGRGAADDVTRGASDGPAHRSRRPLREASHRHSRWILLSPRVKTGDPSGRPRQPPRRRGGRSAVAATRPSSQTGSGAS